MKKLKIFKNISSEVGIRPSYELYIQLWYTLYLYFNRINEYIFFEYYNWDAIKIKLVNKLSINDLNKLKRIYEYDYQVFKVLLFLYWDLECYLENVDYVKQTLKVDSNGNDIYNIMYKNKVIPNIEYWNKILTKKPINLWTNLEIHGMFDKILKYATYSKVSILDTRHKNNSNIKFYKLYKKTHDLMLYGDINVLRLIKSLEDSIKLSYYSVYIEKWHKEWYSEINQDLTIKYKSKIKALDLEYKSLLECLIKFNINK